jgi:hypothetical protein
MKSNIPLSGKATASEKTAVGQFESLWALPIPKITIITGPYGVGKSTLAVSTGALPDRMCVIDMEKSQTSDDQQLHYAKYVDFQANMAISHPNGYKPLDAYATLVKTFEEIGQDQYDVIILDNASQIEDCMVSYVESHPQEFGLTTNQINSSGGLKWGAVKNLEMQVLSRLASKAKMLIIVMQLRDKWAGNSPAKNAMGEVIKEPKGKETLEMLSSLFLWLEPGAGGVPAARVIKARVDRKVFIKDPTKPPKDIPDYMIARLNGEPGIVTVPVLPLRIPVCTWPVIRAYMRTPADLRNPLPGETVSDKVLSEDERLKIRSVISQNEVTIAELKANQQVTQKEDELKRGKIRLTQELATAYPNPKEVGDTMATLHLTYTLAKHDEIKERLLKHKAEQPKS